MMSRFHEGAEAELADAVLYYDERAPGLGDRFVAEVKAATLIIERHPEIAPLIGEGVRAKVVQHFPYSLMYVIDPDGLFVVAVAHQSKRPGYWADRLPSTVG